MKIKIVERLDRTPYYNRMSESTPLSYRVSLKLERINTNIHIIYLTREYFVHGYIDGEGHNKYYFNNRKVYYEGGSLHYASFITRDIDNEELKQEAEEILLREFQKECLVHKNLIKKKLDEEIKEVNDNINLYENLYNFFDGYKRSEKIKKILNRINEYN